MRKFLETIFLIAVIGVIFVLFRQQWTIAGHQAYNALFPCSQPLTYKIGTIDPRFHLTQKQFLSAIQSAEAIWEKGSDKNLFTYDQENGTIPMSLVYDYRQQAIDKLQSVGIKIDDTQASYDQLKAKYDTLQVDYKNKKVQFDADVAAFQSKQSAYNEEVQSWNARGGAPKNVYNQLQSERASLDGERARIQSEQDSLNAEVDEVNALATTLNRLAGALNLEVSSYNQIGASTGGEFEEGVYESGLGQQKIDIYEFGDMGELTRVLAHEMGHALGLEHVGDKSAIMYKLNQSTNEKMTVADYNELKRVCKLR